MLLALGAASPSTAVPWVKERGDLYTRVGYDYYRASSAFDAAGERAPMADERFMSHLGGVFDQGVFASHSGSFYGEVGLGWHLEAFASIPVSRVSNTWTFAIGESDDRPWTSPCVRSSGPSAWRATSTGARVYVSLAAAQQRAPLVGNQESFDHGAGATNPRTW